MGRLLSHAMSGSGMWHRKDVLALQSPGRVLCCVLFSLLLCLCCLATPYAFGLASHPPWTQLPRSPQTTPALHTGSLAKHQTGHHTAATRSVGVPSHGRVQHSTIPPPLHHRAESQQGEPSGWPLACLGVVGWAVVALVHGRGTSTQPVWGAAGYYGRGFQKAGQMTDEKAWLVANQLVLVKDKPAKDRWAPSELKGDVVDPDTAEHPDVAWNARYPSTPGSGTWGLPLPNYPGWQAEREEEREGAANAGEVYDPTRPQFLDETLAYLDVREGGRYLDAAFGIGSFSSAILATANCHVTALDDAPRAADLAHQLQGRHPGRFDFLPISFSEAEGTLASKPLEPPELFDGVVLDLGPLGEKVDREQKGLAVNDNMFIQDAPLEESMAHFLNTAYPELLAYVIYWYGREVQGRALARTILRERQRSPIRTKFQLARVVRNVGERHYVLFDGIDPAKRVFLAIRIFLIVERLTTFLAGLKALLAVDGRLVVCSYHPWLDGIVKNFMDCNTLKSTIPRKLPPFRPQPAQEEQHVVLLKPIEWLRVLTRVPLSKGQSATHPGWPLARLRVAERVDPREEEERQAPKWNF